MQIYANQTTTILKRWRSPPCVPLKIFCCMHCAGPVWAHWTISSCLHHPFAEHLLPGRGIYDHIWSLSLSCFTMMAWKQLLMYFSAFQVALETFKINQNKRLVHEIWVSFDLPSGSHPVRTLHNQHKQFDTSNFIASGSGCSLLEGCSSLTDLCWSK